MTKTLSAALVALLGLLSLPAAAETLRLSGASQVFAGIFYPHKAELERATGLVLELKSSSSADGVLDLVAGKADLAMISNDLPGIVASIDAAGTTHLVQADLVESEIATTEIAFIVNPSNPIGEAHRDTLAGLLSGRITNWSEVGGRDAPVLVITAPSGGMYPDIEDEVLRPLGLRWDRNASALRNVVFVMRAVAQSVNAISYMGPLARAPEMDRVKVLKTDVHIKEPLTLVSLGAPRPAAQRLIDAARALAR